MIVVRASTDQRNDQLKKLRPQYSQYFTRLYHRNTVYWIDPANYPPVVDRNILFLTDEQKNQVPGGIILVKNYIKAYWKTGEATRDLNIPNQEVIDNLVSN